jgi:hypothetical protein
MRTDTVFSSESLDDALVSRLLKLLERDCISLQYKVAVIVIRAEKTS